MKPEKLLQCLISLDKQFGQYRTYNKSLEELIETYIVFQNAENFATSLLYINDDELFHKEKSIIYHLVQLIIFFSCLVNKCVKNH